MNETLEKIRTISNRLARALVILVIIFIPGALYAHTQPNSLITSPPMAAFVVGMIGGFVGLQRRIKKLSDDDLTLLANSWVYVCLSPLVGGILAVLTYVLFVSGLLSGDLFPEFVVDDDAEVTKGLAVIFNIHGEAEDYGKMLFWSFVAGFSERFATDIISRFESQTPDEPRQTAALPAAADAAKPEDSPKST